MTILEKYRANVVMDINLTKGSLTDQSGNGNNATPTGFNTWGVWRKQRALRFGTGKYLTVADTAALRSADYTLIAVGDYQTAVSNARLFSKRGATVNYELYISATGTQLGIYNGTTSSLLTTTIKDNRFIACRVANRQAPSFFVDGVNKGQGGSPLTANTTDTPSLILGNMADGVSGPISSLNSRFIMLNTAAITDAEMAQLYEELMNEGGGLKSPSKGFVYPTPLEITGKCVLHWDMHTKTGDGKMLDNTGNGRNGTISQASISSGVFDKSLSFGGNINSNVQVANGFTDTISGNQNAAVSMWFNASSIANNPVIITNHNSLFYIQLYSGQVVVQVGTSPRVYSVADVAIGRWVHIYFEKTGSGDSGNLYVNGTLQSSYTGTIQDMPTVAASFLKVGSYNSSTPHFSGAIDNVKLFSSNLTISERTKEYQDGAKLLRFREDLKYTPVTTANLAAAGSPSIPNTDYSISTGTWKVTEDSTGKRKIVSAVAASSLSLASKKAYGTWVFELGNGSPYIRIAIDKIGSAVAAQQFYIMYIGGGGAGNVVLAKSIAGSTTNLMGTANGYCTGTNTYKFCLTRDFTGKFTLYIKGGQYPNWIKVDVTGGLGTNPATNNDITAANYFNLVSQTIGDNFGLVAHLEGVIDPTVNPNLIP